MKKPKATAKTAQESAVERRQTLMLDEEIEEQEERFRALSRGKLGKASLLGGAPRTAGEAASGGTRSTASAAGAGSRASLVGGISGGTGGGRTGMGASIQRQ